MSRMSTELQSAWQSLEGAQRLMRAEGLAAGVPGLMQAVQGFHREGDSASESYALNILASVQHELGNFEEAAKYHETGLVAARALDSPGTAVVAHLNGLGMSLGNMGRWQEAQQFYQQALAETDKPIVAMRKQRAHLLSHLADLYARYTDRKEEALSLYDASIAISREHHDEVSVAAALNMKGQALAALERPEEALRHYEQARGIIEPLNEPGLLAACYSHIGQSYLHLGKARLAQQYIERALELDEQYGNKQGLTRDLWVLAGIQSSLGDEEASMATLKDAFVKAQEMHDLKLVIYTLRQMAGLSSRRLQGGRAREYLEMALDYSRQLGDEQSVIEIETALAAHGEFSDLLDALEKNLASARRQGLVELEADLELELGYHYEQRGALVEAETHYTRAAHLIEQLRSSYRAEDHLRAFNASRADDFERLVKVCLQLRKDEEAFAWAEKSRARVLQAIRQNRAARTAAVLSDSQLARYRQVCDRLIEIDFQIQQLELTGSPVPPELREQLQDSLQSEADAVLTAWRAVQGIQEAAKPAEAHISALQERLSALAPNSVVLSYYTFDSEVYVFIVTAEDFSTRKLQCDTAKIRETIRHFRAGLGIREVAVRNETPPLVKATHEPAAPGMSRAAALSADYLSHSTRLYDLLLRPFQHLIEHSTHLCVIPHGPLHFLPFHALHDGERYLTERLPVSYAPSASILLECLGGNPFKISDVLALGDPASELPALPFAREEVERVQQLVGPEHCLKEVGTGATREVVMRASNGSEDVWHFATHAQFVQAAPQLSYLQMAQNDSSDGRLFAYEIAALKRVPRLNIISACRTAMTREARGDDLGGLMFSFLAGGAQTVMASLWFVADRSTADLMIEFYRQHLSVKSLDLAQSLREAQLALLRRPLTSSPFYWAPFVLHGNWNPVASPVSQVTSSRERLTTGELEAEVKALLSQADSHFGRARVESEKQSWRLLPDAEKEHLEQAVNKYTLVLEQMPEHAAARRQRGLAYSKLFETGQAEADLRRACELDESDPFAAAALGLIYAESEGAEEDCRAAFKYLSRAFRLDPRVELKYPLRNSYRLRSALERCRAKLDVEEYTRRLAVEPDDASLYVGRGQAYWLLGIYGDDFQSNREKALADFGQALRLNPHSALAMVRKAWVETPGEANEFYARAIELDPSCAEAHLRLAQSVKDRDGRLAIAEFKAAMAYDPSIEHAHCGLGQAYLDQGELPKALEAFETEVRSNLNCFDAHLYLTQIYFAVGRQKEAAHANRESIRTTSHTPYQGGPGVGLSDDVVYWIRGLAGNLPPETGPEAAGIERREIHSLFDEANRLANSGQSAEAAAVYTEILRHDPQNARAYAFRGGCYATLLEYNQAISDLHRAIELNPDNADAWYNLSVIYHNRMQFTEAREARAKALLLDPGMVKRKQEQEREKHDPRPPKPFNLDEALEKAYREAGISCAHCGRPLRRPLGTQFFIEDQDAERVREGIPFYCTLCRVNSCYKCRSGGTDEEPWCKKCSTVMTKWGEADAEYARRQAGRGVEPESGACVVCRQVGPLRYGKFCLRCYTASARAVAVMNHVGESSMKCDGCDATVTAFLGEVFMGDSGEHLWCKECAAEEIALHGKLR